MDHRQYAIYFHKNKKIKSSLKKTEIDQKYLYIIDVLSFEYIIHFINYFYSITFYEGRNCPYTGEMDSFQPIFIMRYSYVIFSNVKIVQLLICVQTRDWNG